MRDPECGGGVHCGQHGGGPAHVGLHGLHAGGRLERQAARVEGDPLAHQGQVGHPTVDLDGVGGLVVDPDQAGRLGRAAGHPEQAAQPLLDDPLLVPDLDASSSATSAKRSDEVSANRSGVSELGGSLTRSRASATDSASRAPARRTVGHRRDVRRAMRRRRPEPTQLRRARRRCGSRRSGRRPSAAPRPRPRPPRRSTGRAGPPPGRTSAAAVPLPTARTKAAEARRSDSMPGDTGQPVASPTPTRTTSAPGRPGPSGPVAQRPPDQGLAHLAAEAVALAPVRVERLGSRPAGHGPAADGDLRAVLVPATGTPTATRSVGSGRGRRSR